MMAEAVRIAIDEMRDTLPSPRPRRRRLRAVLWLGSTVAGEWFRQMGTTQVEVLTALDWVSHACDVMENNGDVTMKENEWTLLFLGVAALWDAPRDYPSREKLAPRAKLTRPWRNDSR